MYRKRWRVQLDTVTTNCTASLPVDARAVNCDLACFAAADLARCGGADMCNLPPTVTQGVRAHAGGAAQGRRVQ